MTLRWAGNRPPGPYTHGAIRIASVVRIALVAISVLAVNLLPTVTNDSLTYVDQSGDLTTGGVVEGGYRDVSLRRCWIMRSADGSGSASTSGQ